MRGMLRIVRVCAMPMLMAFATSSIAFAQGTLSTANDTVCFSTEELRLIVENVSTGNEALEKYDALVRLYGINAIRLKNESAKAEKLQRAKNEMEAAFKEQKTLTDLWHGAYLSQRRGTKRWKVASLLFGGVMIGSILTQ
jgi:hypothetical protein